MNTTPLSTLARRHSYVRGGGDRGSPFLIFGKKTP